MPKPNLSALLSLIELERRESPTSLEALGPKGINLLANPDVVNGVAQTLEGVTGSGVRLAMIEGGRPGLKAPAPAAPANAPPNGQDVTTHFAVKPLAVFEVDKPGTNNKPAVLATEGHATQVASVMIGQFLVADDPYSVGASPKAQLLAACTSFAPFTEAEINARAAKLKMADATLTDKTAKETASAAIFFEQVGRAIRHLATVQIGQLAESPRPAAFNLSVQPTLVLPNDGSSQHSLMLDYFARRYDTLFVTATSNESDQWKSAGFAMGYNVLSVGAMKPNLGGQYNQVSNETSPLIGTRSLVQIVAPGEKVIAADYLRSGQAAAQPDKADGTSLATPFVTAAVALLTEYAAKNKATLPVLAADHNVLRAVILNSADKLKGELPGPNNTQAMLRDVFGPQKVAKKWSDYNDIKDEYVAKTATSDNDIKQRQERPLNPDFGAGGAERRSNADPTR